MCVRACVCAWSVVAVTPCRRIEATSRHRCGSPSSSRSQSVVLLATRSASMDAPSGAVLFSFSGSFLSCSWFSFLVSSVRAIYLVSGKSCYSQLSFSLLCTRHWYLNIMWLSPQCAVYGILDYESGYPDLDPKEILTDPEHCFSLPKNMLIVWFY